MIAYHCDTNTILRYTLASKNDKHRIPAYNSVMKRLAKRGHNVDVQVIDNEVSAEYKRVITEEWEEKFQLVPPNVHQRNVAERAIRTFKARFLSVLAGVDPGFPKYMWDQLLVQMKLTLNLLRQATLNPHISAREYFNGKFYFLATPLGQLGRKVVIHNTVTTQKI